LNGQQFKCEYPGLELLPDIKGLDWDIKTDPSELDESVPAGVESSESRVTVEPAYAQDGGDVLVSSFGGELGDKD
jgi:hypothetical protein